MAHPEVRSRQRAKKHGLIKTFMATASPYVNIGLHYVTGQSPPNTDFTQEELAFHAAVKLKQVVAELGIIKGMLGATAPLLFSLDQSLRIEAISADLQDIAEHAEKHTALAARHQQRILKN